MQRDTGGAVLPSVGQPCSSIIGTVGTRLDRRALGTCLATALEAATARVAPARRARPSFVVIVTDDQRWDTLDGTHSTNRRMPVMPAVLSELAASGVTFTNAFVSTALCGPSRASLMTGQYAHSTGVRTNLPPTGSATQFRDGETLATWLQRAGYRTGLYGKYLNGYDTLWSPPDPPYVPPGWDEWHAFVSPQYFDYRLVENGADHQRAVTRYPSACPAYFICPGDLGLACPEPANYSTETLVAKAREFIERSGDQPFFLYLAPYAPHWQACAAPRDVGPVELRPWRPRNWDRGVAPRAPAWLQPLCPMPPRKREGLDAFRVSQVVSLRAVDRGVSEIMDLLRRTGRDRDTVVIFTSDNGYSWGSHCHGYKQCPYDECNRVPLIIRAPMLTHRARKNRRLVLNIDIAPTVVELAGAAPGLSLDGRSMVPLLRGASGRWRRDFLYEQWFDQVEEGASPPDLAAVRSRRWNYVEYASGETEMYDVRTDPYELTNRAYRKANSARRARLAARLRRLRPDWHPTVSPSMRLLPNRRRDE